jgi:hypothetical protein
LRQTEMNAIKQKHVPTTRAFRIVSIMPPF